MKEVPKQWSGISGANIYNMGACDAAAMFRCVYIAAPFAPSDSNLTVPYSYMPRLDRNYSGRIYPQVMGLWLNIHHD